MKTKLTNLFINTALLSSGISASFTGFLLLIKYHLHERISLNTNEIITDNSYYILSSLHKFIVILLSIFIIIHFYRHLKWYGTVLCKKLFSGNKYLLLLTVFFCLVAFSGFISWTINLLADSESFKINFIEIHDKIAILLFVLLTVHIVKKRKWFFRNYKIN